MRKLVTGMLVSAALAMLVGSDRAYAQADRQAPNATYAQQDRGRAIDTEATGEEGGSGPRVRVTPDDVVTGGRVVPIRVLLSATSFCATTTRADPIDNVGVRASPDRCGGALTVSSLRRL
jgi:hypothetical protein